MNSNVQMEEQDHDLLQYHVSASAGNQQPLKAFDSQDDDDEEASDVFTEDPSSQDDLPSEDYIPLSMDEPLWAGGKRHSVVQKSCFARFSEHYNGPIRLSKQQMDVLEAVAVGKSVFMTGSAGTGKSFVLKYILRILRRSLGEQCVYVTASTGLAACSLSGTTLHSFAGIGLGEDSPDRLVAKVMSKKEARERWVRAQALIIDEVSMIDGELFDKLNYVAKCLKNSERWFGGIQLIVTGDFFQLPPVNPPNRQKYFAFQADCWRHCFDLQVELKHVFRQADGGFVKMLNEIRKGAHSPQTVQQLKACFRVLADDGSGITPTRLYPLKVDVKQENEQELKALAREVVVFAARDSSPNPLHRYMLTNMRTEKELHLCIGAQVMLVKNLDTSRGLVNGAKGVVVDFQYGWSPEKNDRDGKELEPFAHSVSPTNMWPLVRFASMTKVIGPYKETVEDGGIEVASRVQVPLILAWALSVHKCQGMTLDKVETDLRKAFEYGMVYVALSRVKNLDGLQLVGFDPSRIKVHPNVIIFNDSLEAK